MILRQRRGDTEIGRVEKVQVNGEWRMVATQSKAQPALTKSPQGRTIRPLTWPLALASVFQSHRPWLRPWLSAQYSAELSAKFLPRIVQFIFIFISKTTFSMQQQLFFYNIKPHIIWTLCMEIGLIQVLLTQMLNFLENSLFFMTILTQKWQFKVQLCYFNVIIHFSECKPCF